MLTVLGVVQPCLALLQGRLLLGASRAAVGTELLRSFGADVALLLHDGQWLESTGRAYFLLAAHVSGGQTQVLLHDHRIQ
jgi:hypothetical protein